MSSFWSAVVNYLLRSVPAHLMAYYPFRDRLRFPVWTVLLSVGLLQLGQSVLYGFDIWRGGSGVEAAYGLSLVYMAIYFASVRDDRLKVLFLYLLVTDYIMIFRGLAAFSEARFFYQPDMTFDSWTSVAFNLTALAVTVPFMLRFFNNAREKVFSTDAPLFWKTAWIIPAFNTVVAMLFTADFQPEKVRSLRFLFVRLLLSLCAFVVYYILLNSLDGIRRQAALAEQAATQEQLLNLQRMQHDRLLKYMEAVKAARHDLRQHLGVMDAYLAKGDIDGLKQYLQAYGRTVPSDTQSTFTRNFALNAVCAYYAEEAQKYEIQYDVKLDIPEYLPVDEPEVCALLGNLLENAVDACREMEHGPRFIRIRSICEGSHIVLTVDNSCSREPRWSSGRLLSSKHKGLGTGTYTVRETAERSGGGAEFTFKDGVFYASVFLCGQLPH